MLAAILLWQLGGLAKTDAARLRPIIVVFFASLVAIAALNWIYFFPIPGVMASLTAICLVLAIARTGKLDAGVGVNK